MDQRVIRRVLHLINGEHYSGAERVQDLLALRLSELGYEVSFACLTPDRFPGARRSRQSELFETPMKGRFDISTVKRLSELVQENGFSLLHAHTPRSLMVGAFVSRQTGVPLIYHVHSPAVADSTKGIRNRLNAVVEKVCSPLVSQMIAVSDSLRGRMVSQGIKSSKVKTVRNGVEAPETIRADTKPGNPWALGMVALFRERKGTEVLLDAMAQLHRRGFEIRLRAVGPFETPEYEEAVKSYAKSLGLTDHIEWVGFTENVNEELSKIDLMVLPSLFGEGLPMVLLEAMASGVPTVGSSVEGVPEVITHGENGLLVKAADVDALADAILSAFDGREDWGKLRGNAIKTHATHYSDLAMARGVAEVYNGILAD